MSLTVVKRTRQNHAMEHATIAVLLEKGATVPLAGIAAPGGFYLCGQVPTEDVTSAAQEALLRLQAGNHELAISPHCGTNLVVGALLAGLVSSIVLGRSKSRLRRVECVATGFLVATFLGRPLGKVIQRRYTTLSHVGGVEITTVSRIKLGRLTVHRVRTAGPAV